MIFSRLHPKGMDMPDKAISSEHMLSWCHLELQMKAEAATMKITPQHDGLPVLDKV